MSHWWRAYDEAVDDPKLGVLSDRQFRKKFYACLGGEVNEFIPFLRIGRDRPSASVWAKLRSSVFRRDNFTCTYCTERGGRLECDHIIPVSRGGTEALENLTTACFACNRSKRAKTIQEWLI
jgi:hypothetical protein